MKIERTRNAKRNIIFGGLQKIYHIIMPFILRTLIIYVLGDQYLGLNSLFTSVLQVLNLAEMGVGSAMVYSMYKPIAENDTKKICALMQLYKIYYRCIGLMILVIGLCLTPFIPSLIADTIPADINIFVLYYLNLGATVLSYWLFAYKNSILQAHQRVDIVSKVTIVTDTIRYVFQIITLFLFKNYYYYVILILVTQAMTNICTAIVANKMFPQYHPEGKLPKKDVKKINQSIRDLFTAKFGGVVLNSADTIVISAFLGLTVLAIYQNYFYILTSVIAIVQVIYQACMAGIGNSLVVEDNKKNYADLEKFTFMIAWLSGVCVAFFLCLYQPFMRIWMGEERLLDFGMVICFCIYFFVYEINMLLNLFKDAGGIWHTDRWRPLVTSLVNLTLNLILVQYIGIFGIIFSTVLATICVGMPWLLNNIFTEIFKCDRKPYILKLLKYATMTTIAATLTYFIARLIPGNDYVLVIVRGILCCIIPNIFFFVVYRKCWEFGAMKVLLKKMVKR